MIETVFLVALVSAGCYANGVWLPVVPVPAYNYSGGAPPGQGSNLAWGCRPHYYNATGTHSLFVGCVGYNDKLLYSEAHVRSSRWFASQEVIIQYPPPGHVRYETVTGVWIFDRYRNGKGGYARVLSGGVGNRNVTVQLYNDTWFGRLNFLVQIYGN